jgi:hypothetical protein
MIWLIILLFSTILVNETVDIAVHDALLDGCRGSVEISGNSKLSNFTGKVVARNANLTIVESEIDNLYCYNSTVRAYHNLIHYTELHNCTFIASLNTFISVKGYNSTYRNGFVTYTVFNMTRTEYIGNYWLFGSFSAKPVDEDMDYVSDFTVCPLNINIDGSHFCERPLLAMHVSYSFHGAHEPGDVLGPAPDTPVSLQETSREELLPTAVVLAAISAAIGVVGAVFVLRRMKR